jgi:hypothetical protein
MALGSLSFLRVLEELTGTPRKLFRRSLPFIYGIPADSLLSVEKVSQHFSSVDRAIAEIYRERPELSGDEGIPPVIPLPPKQLGDILCRETVAGAFQTGEFSLDTEQVARVVAASIEGHPNIRVYKNTSVVMAERTVGGNYAIHARYGTETRIHRYRFIANCLWGDRIRVDEGVGIVPSRPWLMRYKAAITLRRRVDSQLLRCLPSATLILGPYGDVVNHGSGKVYVSWYPICKLAETSTSACDPLFETAAHTNQALLVHESLEALSRYIPYVENLARGNDSVEVGGGVICAWGSTDITDIESGLHQRYRIGPSVHDNWISLDTGKYCMAPLFGLQTAEVLASLLK